MGKGRFMCQMCAPWGLDVERTRCLELRPFPAVSTDVEEGADGVDMDVADDDGEPLQFYVQRRALEDHIENQRKTLGDQSPPLAWPAHVCHRQFERVECVVSMADGCAQLRDKVHALTKNLGDESLERALYLGAP